jgi:hypothetical protein
MNLDLHGFLERYEPAVLLAYEHYRKYSFDDLKPDTRVITLRSGFAGCAGCIRLVGKMVEERCGRVVELHSTGEGYGHISLLLESDDRDGPWWKSVRILTPEDVKFLQTANRVNRNKWCLKHIGLLLE